MREIEEIASAINMNHWDILKYDPESRTPYLRLMKDKLVRSEIIQKYTWIDENLTLIITHFYFGRRDPLPKLWRTKRFRIFRHYMMDEAYILGKTRVVDAIGKIPSQIRQKIERINALRNAIAHGFFPGERRQYAKYKKAMYQGFDIYSRQGLQKLQKDFEDVADYLVSRAYGFPRGSLKEAWVSS